MTKEEIIEEIVKFAGEKTDELSDADYMEIYYEVSDQLKTSADCKAEELGID